MIIPMTWHHLIDENWLSDFDKQFQDCFASADAIYMCYPFTESVEVDFTQIKIAALFHLNMSAVQEDFDSTSWYWAEVQGNMLPHWLYYLARPIYDVSLFPHKDY